jgi:hypothetical protein
VIPRESAVSLTRFEREPDRKNGLHTLTDSALYSPVDDPEVFVGFGFVAALIIVSCPTQIADDAGGKLLGKSLYSRAVTGDDLIRSTTIDDPSLLGSLESGLLGSVHLDFLRAFLCFWFLRLAFVSEARLYCRFRFLPVRTNRPSPLQSLVLIRIRK